MKFKYLFLVLITILTFSGCKDFLTIDYDNKPDKDIVLNNPDDVYGLASGLFFNWYINQYYSYTYSPVMAMWTMADQGTSSWLNGGMYDLSSEPRAAFNNTEEYDWKLITETYYQKMYADLSQANDILSVLNEGMEIGTLDADGKGADTEMIRAFSYFIQGVTMGYLGLTFDKAYIVTDKTEDPAGVETSSYKTVIDSAVASLDKCIAVCNNNGFTVPDDWINGSTYSNNELAQLASSFAARFLVYCPRNASENEQVDWQRVYNYANNGIQKNLAPFMDNVTWHNYFFHYTVSRDNWVRIDARIINLMDPSYPWRYPDLSSEPAPGEASSADARLTSDFTYNPVCNFRPERGYYHFSNYEYTRYPYSFDNPDYVTDFSVAENDLIKAEALFHNGQKNTAIDIINSGTRVTRGNLPPLDYSISDEDFLKALFYERDIELIMTGYGIAYFDMRRRDMLQEGTPLHFPIPAKELNVMYLPLYTFGGVENADGINTSNGGWFPSK